MLLLIELKLSSLWTPTSCCYCYYYIPNFYHALFMRSSLL